MHPLHQSGQRVAVAVQRPDNVNLGHVRHDNPFRRALRPRCDQITTRPRRDRRISPPGPPAPSRRHYRGRMVTRPGVSTAAGAIRGVGPPRVRGYGYPEQRAYTTSVFSSDAQARRLVPRSAPHRDRPLGRRLRPRPPHSGARPRASTSTTSACRAPSPSAPTTC